MDKVIRFSVIMPTYNQCCFIRRAILSLMQQTYPHWELIIVNDGCTDETEEFISDYLADERITYIKNEENQGLGHALNQGLDAAKYEYIAYLPSDDFYFENHLESFVDYFTEYPELCLAFSGMQYDASDTMYRCEETECNGILGNHCLQLVQTTHKKYPIRWMERSEYVTEDYFQMYWGKLLDKGCFGRTNKVTCNWTSHPNQYHRIIGERFGGGLNRYRISYNVKDPVKMRVSHMKFIDEEKLYTEFRREYPISDNSLKILIIGELAYNPERIYALEQAGHQLYGIWDEHPQFTFSMSGNIPFGHIKRIPLNNWKQEVERIKPDVIYALLNFGSVPFIYSIVSRCQTIPYVWHFKEGPTICLRQGNFDKLIWLFYHAAGIVYLNELAKDWYNQFLPPSSKPSIIMDGDLPFNHCFKECYSKKLSDTVGGIHTVITGRLIGISLEDLQYFASHDIHIHLYTENYFDDRNRENEPRLAIAPNHFHLHQHVEAERWTEELSKYDAGWLHCTKSKNDGKLIHAYWDDLNLPARISTYAAAGLPVILPKNEGHLVAIRDQVEKLGVGITYSSVDDLVECLKIERHSRTKCERMKEVRNFFTFNAHVDELVKLFRDVTSKKI